MSESTDLTKGRITPSLLKFTLPMIAGALLQQCYNIADTIIVGQCIGTQALAAIGSAYTLMVFIISILLGLSMGAGTVFSLQFGSGKFDKLRQSVFVSLLFIGTITIVLNAAAFIFIDDTLSWLQVPADVMPLMRTYLLYIYGGMIFTFIYNYYAALLRSVGDSVTPLIFLSVSVVLNIALDLILIIPFGMGIDGAAIATVVSQAAAAAGIIIFTYKKRPELRISRSDMVFSRSCLKEIISFSSLTCIQQSVMNFGILMVQGLVNSFGLAVMAAFAAAVKIDSFAYMPVQEFGNSFSTFVAQNFGAQKTERIRKGIKSAFLTAIIFSLIITAIVFAFAEQLMTIFISPEETEIIGIGSEYLRIEGAFYAGIGILFLLYGYYRAVRMPEMSVVLTVLSLGIRVALSYWLSSIPSIGVDGIWWSIPIGWFIADLVGMAYYWIKRNKQLTTK